MIKVKKINKKAVFYLLFTSVLLLLIITVFMTYKQYMYMHRQQVIATRVYTIDELIKDIDFDSKRVIYVSGFRSLIALEDHVARTGDYINNPEELFKIAFYNGTINSTGISVLENSSYTDYLNKLQLIASRIGVNLFLNVTNITLKQDTPWSVNVTVVTHVQINDTRSFAAWDFYKNYSTSVSIINIRDPLYTVSTKGKVPVAIRQTNITNFVNQATNDTTNLQLHINGTFYRANVLAPSFLMRLSGNFSNSPYGIESFVYVPELSIQEVSYNSSRSLIDYVFFTNVSGYSVNACNVKNMPSWFKVDLNHTTYYEINKLNYTVC